jgi:hypothetical protein
MGVNGCDIGVHDRKVEHEKLVLAPLLELSLQIVEFAREHGRITVCDAIRLTNGNRNTLKQHFRALTSCDRGNSCPAFAGAAIRANQNAFSLAARRRTACQ